jgi:hypothetical protein
VIAVATPAGAQEDLTRGKTPAQLFASDCQGCHRDPHSVVTMSAANLQAYLRVHYTASQDSAAVLARYLAALGPPPKSSRKPATVNPAAPRAGKAEAAKEEKSKEPRSAVTPPEKTGEAGAVKPAQPEKKPEEEKKAEDKPAEKAADKPGEAVKDEKPAAKPEEKPAGSSEQPPAAPSSPPANPQ